MKRVASWPPSAPNQKKKKKNKAIMANLESSGIMAYSVMGTKQKNARKKNRLFPITELAGDLELKS